MNLLFSMMRCPLNYTKNQIDKLGNALIFISQSIESASKTHLLKLIFILEETSVKRFGLPFFDLRFHVWKLGPVSPDLFVELSEQPNWLAEFIGQERFQDYFKFVPKKIFLDDEFSDNEIKLLEEVVDRFKYCTAKELVDFTHRKNTPWYNAAVKNGVYELLENGKMNTTDIEINLADDIENDEDKLALYKSHRAFLLQSKSLKS
ncbi:MAG: SocA family protein [Ferruginibacter sp.]|nr:SocA family protein [Ferruginibacter sp.]